MSIDAVAVAGMTFDACAPTRALAMPRMFSDGCVISSVSDMAVSLGRPQPQLAHQLTIDVRRFGDGRFSVSLSGAISS